MASERKKINFTEEERSILIDLVSKHSAVIENKRTDAVSVHQKKKKWEEIVLDFNSRHGVRPRSSQQLRKCWENLKEKWRKSKATDTKELFRTGGGSAAPSSLTEELERVGAVASHMSVRIDNPFDSDRARHGAANAGSGSDCTAAVARLLAPSQPQPISATGAAVNGTEDADELQDFIYEGDTEILSLSSQDQDQADDLIAPPRHSSPQPPAQASGVIQSTGTSTAPPTRSNRRRTALEEELDARLQAVAEERSQRRKEHLLRMRMMRAERKEHKAINAQKLQNTQMKAAILQLKAQLLKKQMQ